MKIKVKPGHLPQKNDHSHTDRNKFLFMLISTNLFLCLFASRTVLMHLIVPNINYIKVYVDTSASTVTINKNSSKFMEIRCMVVPKYLSVIDFS